MSEAASLLIQRGSLNKSGVVFVPYPAYVTLLVLWISGALRHRYVVADAFIDIQTTLRDRRILPENSLRMRLVAWAERFTLSRADCVLIDTREQATLLRRRLSSSGSQVVVVPVGIDESLWSALPAPEPTLRIRVVFWGTFIPLHGMSTIVDAALLLAEKNAEIDFCIIGDGQEAPVIATRLAGRKPVSLSWRRELVDTATLRAELASSHIVLGVFGTSSKAEAVIPYKVQQALACNRPLITRSSAAIASYVDEPAGLMTVPPGDSVALAEAIEDVAGRLRAGWAPSTREIYEAHFSTTAVREALRGAFAEALGKP